MGHGLVALRMQRPLKLPVRFPEIMQRGGQSKDVPDSNICCQRNRQAEESELRLTRQFPNPQGDGVGVFVVLQQRQALAFIPGVLLGNPLCVKKWEFSAGSFWSINRVTFSRMIPASRPFGRNFEAFENRLETGIQGLALDSEGFLNLRLGVGTFAIGRDRHFENPGIQKPQGSP